MPEESSTDGGPEFIANETEDFLKRWGIKHRLSSAYFPQSNGRAELAVKATKRLLEDNVGPNGELNTDRVVCALLQHRNTLDRDCSLSPAEILFGRPLRDGMPLLKKSTMIFDNNHIREQWQESWTAKETAMRSRLVRNCENLEANSKELQPLREGDSLFVQNQAPASRWSKKWDKQGVIIATGENDTAQPAIPTEVSGGIECNTHANASAHIAPRNSANGEARGIAWCRWCQKFS